MKKTMQTRAPMTRRKVLTAMTGAGVLLASGLAAPHRAHADPRLDAAGKVIDSLIADLNKLVASGAEDQVVFDAVNEILNTRFDYNRIARFAAGNAWRGASDDQKTRYKEAFRVALLSQVLTYLEYLISVEYTPGVAEMKGTNQLTVTGAVHDKSGRIPDSNLRWRLYAKEGETPRIIDVEVENISLLITLRQEFTSIINANGGDFEALITELKNLSAGSITGK